MVYTATASGKTVAEAAERAAAQLGVTAADVTVEVLEEPKRSLLGKLKSEALTNDDTVKS